LRWKRIFSILLYPWLRGHLFLKTWAFLLGQVFKQTLPELVQNALFRDDKSDCFDHVLFPLGSGGIVSIDERILI